MAEKRKSLGRGLSALLGDAGQAYASLAKVRSSKMVPIETVHAGKYQPRHVFNDDKIEELAASIRANGILQPLVVRRDPNASNGYEIIAGERRWRAAQVARLHEIPVIIKELMIKKRSKLLWSKTSSVKTSTISTKPWPIGGWLMNSVTPKMILQRPWAKAAAISRIRFVC